MLGLYRFFVDCGRMGSLEGLFVANKTDVERSIGKSVYFDEPLGKYSELLFELTDDHIDLLSDDQDKISWLLKIAEPSISGYNPLDFIQDEDD